MSAFLDASVIVAILTREADADDLSARVRAIHGVVYVSSIAVFEAVINVARKKAGAGRRPTAQSIQEARDVVDVFLQSLDAQEVSLAGAISVGALEASQRYGKVVGHPAQLNLGDCFAYACAKARGVPLLYKSDDFAKTDIP